MFIGNVSHVTTDHEDILIVNDQISCQAPLHHTIRLIEDFFKLHYIQNLEQSVPKWNTCFLDGRMAMEITVQCWLEL